MWAAVAAYLGPKLLGAAKGLIPYAIVAAVLLGLWGAHKVIVAVARHQGEAAGRAEVQAKWDADKADRQARLEAAQRRVDGLALLYAATLEKLDAAVARQKEADRVAFDALAARARALPARASIRLSDGAVRLWGDVSRAANTDGEAVARPAAGAPHTADPVPRPADAGASNVAGAGDLWFSEKAVTGFNVAAGLAYLDAKRHWQAVVQRYDALRAQCNDYLNPQEKP